jgi:hypothetical protein
LVVAKTMKSAAPGALVKSALPTYIQPMRQRSRRASSTRHSSVVATA